MLELGAGEFAAYTLHEVYEGCGVALLGMGTPTAVVAVECDGECMGTVALGETLERCCTTVRLPQKDICQIKLKVLEGTGRIKGIIFE